MDLSLENTYDPAFEETETVTSDIHVEETVAAEETTEVIEQEPVLTLEERLFKVMDSSKRLIRNSGKALDQLKEKKAELAVLSEELRAALDNEEGTRDVFLVATDRKRCETDIDRLSKKCDPESMAQELDSLSELITEYKATL